MSENIHIVELSSYESPKITESKRNDWVEYGEDNNYFQFLIDRHHGSSTNNAIINNMSRLIYGRGLDATDASRKPADWAKFVSIVSPESVRKVCKELKMLGQGAFQVIYSDNKKSIVKLEHIPVHLLRAEKCNKDGEIEGYYYSDNWEDVKKFEPKRIPAFGTSKDRIEILYIQPFSVGMKYYSVVDYEGCLPYCILEEEISNYLINVVQNSFSASKVINFNNGVPPEEEQRITANAVKKKFSGSGGDRIVVAFNANKDAATTVEDIPLDDAPAHYEFVSNEAREKILNSHNVTSPMLVGITTENNGFSSNADEIEIASKYFYNTAIRPFQDLILDALKKALAYNGINLDLFFKRLDFLEDIEAKKQEKEAMQMSDDKLESLLNELGEDENEEWELIDAREVDYDNEQELDSQVAEWEQELKDKPSLLSKMWQFATGIASPNRPSEQDKEIDGFYFKVRYKYVGNESPERGFCRAMMRASKIYRKEDIDRMSGLIVNAGFGEFGSDTYDIFKFKGGARCHHKWERRTYVSAKKSASIGSKDTNQISTGKARKFGYRVTNPKEVSMKPNDMPLKGFSPRNNNLPKDVQ